MPRARTAAAQGIAGSLEAASSINYAACAAKNQAAGAKCVTITTCAGTSALLQGGVLPADYTITGTPTSSGWATFTVVFGGQTCAFSIRVNGRVITIDYIDNSEYECRKIMYCKKCNSTKRE